MTGYFNTGGILSVVTGYFSRKEIIFPEFSLEEETLRATLTETGEHEGVEYAVRGSPARFRWSL